MDAKTIAELRRLVGEVFAQVDGVIEQVRSGAMSPDVAFYHLQYNIQKARMHPLMTAAMNPEK